MKSVRDELLIGLMISIVIIGLVFWRATIFNSAKIAPPSGQNSNNSGVTLEEIGKHGTRSDCWLIINNKVLNVTTFLNLHSGGADVIIPYCGKDGTAAFNAIKNGQGHSNQAVSMFENYLIAILGQNILPSASPTSIPTSTGTPVPSKISSGNTALTVAEIAKHNTPGDCWIIINNKVLKITPFLGLHPGGSGTITPYCGKDGTAAFNAIRGGSGHSSNAVAMFENFLIGLVGQSVAPSTLTATPAIQNLNLNQGRGGDDD